MDLSTATPLEIDTRLAELYGDLADANRDRDAAKARAHAAAGDKGRRIRGGGVLYTLTAAEAIARCRAIIADGYQPKPWDPDSPVKAVDKYDNAVARIIAAKEAMKPFDAEYERRPWPRFFYVPGGHIHSTLYCRTCHRDGNVTDVRWWPPMSGKTEAEAVADKGPVLCTVCYPSAPVEHTRGLDKPDRCTGSGQPPRPGTAKRYGRNVYGNCAVCPPEADRQIVLSGNRIRAHKPAPPPPPTVTVVATIPHAADGDTRYDLSNGMFITRSDRVHRRYHGYKYSAWQPGAGDGGIAAFRGGAATLKALLADLTARLQQPAEPAAEPRGGRVADVWASVTD